MTDHIRETLAAADALRVAITDWGDLDALPLRRSDAIRIGRTGMLFAGATTVILMRMCNPDWSYSHIGFHMFAMSQKSGDKHPDFEELQEYMPLYDGKAELWREYWDEILEWMGDGCAVSFGENGTQLIVSTATERRVMPLAKGLS